MYFSTSKLQSLSVHGNIFDGSKLSRALTIQDYIQILIDHDKNLDPELVRLIQNISALTGRQKSQSNQNSNSGKEENNDKIFLNIALFTKLRLAWLFFERVLGNFSEWDKKYFLFHDVREFH